MRGEIGLFSTHTYTVTIGTFFQTKFSSKLNLQSKISKYTFWKTSKWCLVSKFKTLNSYRYRKKRYWRALRKLIVSDCACDTNADCLKGRWFGTKRLCHSDVNGAPTGSCPAVQLAHRGSSGELPPPDLPLPIRHERQSLAQRSQVLPLVTLLYSHSAFVFKQQWNIQWRAAFLEAHHA